MCTSHPRGEATGPEDFSPGQCHFFVHWQPHVNGEMGGGGPSGEGERGGDGGGSGLAASGTQQW